MAAVEALGEQILELRRENYFLRQEVDELRRLRRVVGSAIEIRRSVSSVLAAVTWAEDLEEAQEIAARALRDDWGHDGPPPEDDPSISDNSPTSKGERP